MHTRGISEPKAGFSKKENPKPFQKKCKKSKTAPKARANNAAGGRGLLNNAGRDRIYIISWTPIAHTSRTHDNRSLMPNSRLKRTKIGISPSPSSWCFFYGFFSFVLKSNKASFQNKFSVKVGNLVQEGGGGLTQSQLLQITVFMTYLTLFLPKISEKFTEKIPTFGEGGGGQAGWAKFPTFTENLFCKLP